VKRFLQTRTRTLRAPRLAEQREKRKGHVSRTNHRQRKRAAIPEKAAGTSGRPTRKEYIGELAVVVLTGSLWTGLFHVFIQ